ncbi:HipA N-terminal domain-containing protein [Rhizobium sp. 2MFCol3.1]|uniref:HipA N-terminal domain-containing protein n=1 Tax=Rhizobium sp. 2MFCol3.1 TaxID=1246459 RepID=UPI001FDA2D44|nr:HipA N-terminal domain-containing protein [Rhizobium sp. 2MFCol3.1]
MSGITPRHWNGAAGVQGASIVDYDLDYFVTVASAELSAGRTVQDHRALSVRYPVDLENRYSQSWPPFLLDLMPQGHARRKLTEHFGITEGSRASDLALLLRSATGGIGNLRIKEAADDEAQRLSGVERQGVTEVEILERSDRFMEVADRFGMLASDSSGLQGEWPKLSMTQAHDALFYPDSFVTDDEAIRQPSTYAEGVLIIPRFDRNKKEGVATVRFGEESLVSAIGVAHFWPSRHA